MPTVTAWAGPQALDLVSILTPLCVSRGGWAGYSILWAVGTIVLTSEGDSEL